MMSHSLNGQPVKTWSTPVAKENRKPIPCTLCGFSSFVPAFDNAGSDAGSDAVSDAGFDAVEDETSGTGGFSYVRCKTCGLIQINPQPLPEDVFRRYKSEHSRDYLLYEIANEKTFLNLSKLALADAGFGEIEKKLLDGALNSAYKPKILDAGCATGALLDYLSGRGWDVMGVEISRDEAAYAREKRGLSILETPLEKTRLDSASFDILNASHLIEHLNEPRAFLLEAHRILKSGGYLFLTTPNSDSFQARFFRSNWRSAIFDHLYLFSKRTITELLTQTGFAVEKAVTWGGLAEGIGPKPLKRLLDRMAKIFGFGDVMVVRAVKHDT